MASKSMHAGELLRTLRKTNGWSQIDLGLATGIQHTLISKLERGLRLLSTRHIELLEGAYIFENHELLMLRHQAAVDLARNKFNVDFDRHLPFSPLGAVEELVTDIHNLRLRGYTSVAELLPRQIKYFEALRNRYASSKDRKIFDRLIAKLIIEIVDTYTEITSQYEIVKVTQHYIDLLNTVLYAAKDDPKDYDIGRMLPAIIHYVAGDFETSTTLMRLCVSQVTTSHAKATCVRDVAAAFAILADQGKLERTEAEKQFQRAEEVALKTAYKNIINENDRAKIFEGLSFGRSLLGLPETRELLDEAKKYYQLSLTRDGVNHAFTKVLLDRTDFLNVALDPEADRQIIIDTAGEKMKLLEGTPYTRHRQQIIKRLLTHPDAQVREFGEHLSIPAPRDR